MRKLFMFSVGRELAPATENGTFSDFPKENNTIIAYGDVLLRSKSTGGSELPPYAENVKFSGLLTTTRVRFFSILHFLSSHRGGNVL